MLAELKQIVISIYYLFLFTFPKGIEVYSQECNYMPLNPVVTLPTGSEF